MPQAIILIFGAALLGLRAQNRKKFFPTLKQGSALLCRLHTVLLNDQYTPVRLQLKVANSRVLNDKDSADANTC